MKHLSRFIVFLIIILAFVLGACSVGVASAAQNNPLKIWYENKNGYANTWKVVDDDTGVNYVVVTTELGNGHLSVAVTPRLNADGTLYVTP